MYMVETASSSSNVTTQVLMTSLKEIKHEGKMLSPKEIKEMQQDFNTHNQKMSILESFFLGMTSLSVGDSIDLRSIARGVNANK
jgi:hypothetical protein